MLLLIAVAALLAAPSYARADGILAVECRFSHRANHDPIVFPRMPAASHSHDFIGNVSTGAGSTLRSLRASTGGCLPRADESAYWVPTLYRHGKALTPTSATAYLVSSGRLGGDLVLESLDPLHRRARAAPLAQLQPP